MGYCGIFGVLLYNYSPVWWCSLTGASGSVLFSDLQAGLYVLKIHAHNRKADLGVVKRGFVVTSDPTYCSLVLINRGVTNSESGRDVTVEVKGHGTAAGYSCVLDTELEFSCEYRIAGNIGRELYLADWWISCHTANIKSANIAPTA